MPQVFRCTAWATVLLGVGHGMRYAARPHSGFPNLASAPEEPPNRRRGVWRGLASASAALLAAGDVLGAETHGPSRNKLFSELDAVSDGLVTLEEYMGNAEAGFQKRQTPEASRRRLRGAYSRLFAASDINGDGSLCDREVEYSQYLAMYFARQSTERQIARVVEKIPKVTARMDRQGEESAVEMEVDTDAQVMPDDKNHGVEEEGEFGQEVGMSLLARYDTNKDGRVDKEEFRPAMEEVAVKWGWEEYLDDPEVVEWMAGIWERSDVSGDGTWNAKEAHYSAFLVTSALDSLIFLERTITSDMFRDLDTNRNGKIENAEVDKYVERDGETIGDDADHGIVRRIQDWFVEADMDGDGSLDRNEALELAKRIRDDI